MPATPCYPQSPPPSETAFSELERIGLESARCLGRAGDVIVSFRKSRESVRDDDVALLREVPRRDELSLEEVSRLGELVLELLQESVKHIDARAGSWRLRLHRAEPPSELSNLERELLFAATWVEAARVWRESQK